MKKCAVFGCGLVFSLIKETITRHYNISAFIDNNKKLQGTFLNSTPIISPYESRFLDVDIFILASSDPKNMALALHSAGIPKHKILNGWNYTPNQQFNSYNFSFDNNWNIVCQPPNNTEDLMIEIFDGKIIFFTIHNAPTILALLKESNVQSFLALSEKYHKKSGKFLDIGANIGTTIIEAIGHPMVTGGICFEPEKKNYGLLMKNIRHNLLEKHITCYNHAAGKEAGQVLLTKSPTCSGDNRISVRDNAPPEEDTEIVSAVSLDNFLGEDEKEKIAYLWVDVQGYEYFVLKGAENIISQKSLAVLIEYWPHGLKQTKTLSLLNEYLIDNFNYFIDLTTLKPGKEPTPQPIDEIISLSDKITKTNHMGHTDIFLIK